MQLDFFLFSYANNIKYMARVNLWFIYLFIYLK